MRIKEKESTGSDFDSCELEKQVTKAYQEAIQIHEAKRLFSEMKREASSLRDLFWNEEEQKEKKNAADFFHARMQSMVFYTLKNLEAYQKSGWKELIEKGDRLNGTNDSISKDQK